MRSSYASSRDPLGRVRPTTRRALVGAALLLTVLAGACEYRPARYFDVARVTVVNDDAPIERPGRTEYPDWARYSEAYVRRTLVNALDPVRLPDAGDVNAFDEVPRSSWFDPDRTLLEGYASSGTPTFAEGTSRASLSSSSSETPSDLRVAKDVKGRSWDLIFDPPNHVGLQTGAGAIANRLVYALGYRVAESHVVRLPSGERALAIRWPTGAPSALPAFDLGPTRPSGTHDFDPNDVVRHENRRTLRAFALIADWLGIDEIGPRVLRDVYVGEPGGGHIQHWVVGLEGALGAAALLDLESGAKGDRPPRGGWLSLGTLGFAPKDPPERASTEHAAIGLFASTVHPPSVELSIPFEPADDALIADVYWIAKRVAAIPRGTIMAAVAAAALPVEASTQLERALIRRQGDVVKFALAHVTPLELLDPNHVELRASKTSLELELTDVAIARGHADPTTSLYVIHFLDAAGAEIGERIDTKADGSTVGITLPRSVFDGREYVVMRIRAVRGERLAPRLAEIHLRRTDGVVRVRGVRH